MLEEQKLQRILQGLKNSTWPRTTSNRLNCIFDGHERNQVFIWVIKSIVAKEELLVDYDLNWIDTGVAIMGAPMLY